MLSLPGALGFEFFSLGFSWFRQMRLVLSFFWLGFEILALGFEVLLSVFPGAFSCEFVVAWL